MLEETTLNEVLTNLQEEGIIIIDNSLCVVNSIFCGIESAKQALKKKQEPEDSSTIFLIGIYKCRIKNRLYTINVLLFPRDYQVLVPPEELFNEKKPHPFKRLLTLRGADLNNLLKKKVNPYNNFIEAIANEYYVVGSKKDHTVVGKLKKKLRRYRLRHLNEKKTLKVPLPKTQLGDEIRTLFSVLKLNKHVKRSRRKKINNALRKSSRKYREIFKANRIKKALLEQNKAKRKQIRLKQKQEKDQALYYLERLKTYEKACKGTDLNPLDLFFSHFDNTK